MPTSVPKRHHAVATSRLTWLPALLLAGCAVSPETRLQHDIVEANRLETKLLADGQQNDAPATLSHLSTLLCQLDAETCTDIRIRLIDQPRPQAQLWPNDMLLVTSGLLDEVRDDDELAFALAHELSHRRLAHFRARTGGRWNARTAESAADLAACSLLSATAFQPGAGLHLLQRLSDRDHLKPSTMALLRERISHMAQAPECNGPTHTSP